MCQLQGPLSDAGGRETHRGPPRKRAHRDFYPAAPLATTAPRNAVPLVIAELADMRQVPLRRGISRIIFGVGEGPHIFYTVHLSESKMTSTNTEAPSRSILTALGR